MASNDKKQQGTRIGNFTLIPGSGADAAVKALGAHQDKIAQGHADVGRFLATRPRIITADAGQVPDSAFRQSPVPRPKPMLIEANRGQIPDSAFARPTPARNPVSPGASAGATAPAGGVPASVPAAAPAALKPGDVNTFTGVNGVTRPVPGMQAQATGGVQAQSFGGLAMPTLAAPVAAPAASAAPRQDMGVAIPRPVRADAFNVRQANERNDKIADTIESELFRNSFAAGRGSRSARQAQADMLQTLAQLGGKQLDVAANVAGGDRDASVKGDITGMEQSGASQRAVLGDTGDTTRTGMQEAGATQRVQLQSLADLNRPTQVIDTNGNLLSVTGTQSAPVVGPDGKPVKPAASKADDSARQANLKFYSDQLAATQEALAAAAMAGQDTSALQAQMDDYRAKASALLAGNSTAAGAPSGMTLVGTTKDGKKVYRDANGKTFSE